jgi:hypothetical protein
MHIVYIDKCRDEIQKQKEVPVQECTVKKIEKVKCI